MLSSQRQILTVNYIIELSYVLKVKKVTIPAETNDKPCEISRIMSSK